MERRKGTPGEIGKGFRRRETEYSRHLREKQRVKRVYGMREKQFRAYFKKADKKKGVTGEILLQLLERRLDNTVYRLGFASSRAQARQLVSHAYFNVNGRKVNIASFLVKPGDTVIVRKKIPLIEESLKTSMEVPEWLSRDKESLAGKVERLPARSDIKEDIQERLIVELYSK
jgi:small subunit ribosomal protein S4